MTSILHEIRTLKDLASLFCRYVCFSLQSAEFLIRTVGEKIYFHNLRERTGFLNLIDFYSMVHLRISHLSFSIVSIRSIRHVWKWFHWIPVALEGASSKVLNDIDRIWAPWHLRHCLPVRQHTWYLDHIAGAMLAPLLTRFQPITDKFSLKRSGMVSRVAVFVSRTFFDGISPLDLNWEPVSPYGCSGFPDPTWKPWHFTYDPLT